MMKLVFFLLFIHLFFNFTKQTLKYDFFKEMATSEAKEIKKQETLVRFSIISYKTRLRVGNIICHDPAASKQQQQSYV